MLGIVEALRDLPASYPDGDLARKDGMPEGLAMKDRSDAAMDLLENLGRALDKDRAQCSEMEREWNAEELETLDAIDHIRADQFNPSTIGGEPDGLLSVYFGSTEVVSSIQDGTYAPKRFAPVDLLNEESSKEESSEETREATLALAVEAAVNAGALKIQNALGQEDGGFAGMHFGSREDDELGEIFGRYYDAESSWMESHEESSEETSSSSLSGIWSPEMRAEWRETLGEILDHHEAHHQRANDPAFPDPDSDEPYGDGEYPNHANGILEQYRSLASLHRALEEEGSEESIRAHAPTPADEFEGIKLDRDGNIIN